MATTSSVASFSFNGVTIAAVGTCSVSAARPPIDVTPIGSWNTYHEFGILSTIVQLDVYYSNADHGAIVDQLTAPTGFIPFVVTFSSAAGNAVSGNCMVVGWDSGAATADITRGSFTLQVRGALTTAGQTSVVGGGEPV